MRRMLIAVAAAAALGSAVAAVTAPQYTHEEYGYIGISEEYESAMFYALRAGAAMSQSQLAAAPLVMFLQGGPGGSSMFSDFLETGPVEVRKANNTAGYDLFNNTYTWANYATMLYVDNPVGTGFSYTRDERGYATTDTIIASDLVVFMQGFLAKYPQYVTNDFWVFCESYGGKMTAYFGSALVEAIAAHKVKLNFKGVALGDGWVDPVGCMKSYAPYLSTFSQVNPAEAAVIDKFADLAQSALEEGNGTLSTFYWGQQQQVISGTTSNVNFYNVLYYYDYTAEDQWTKYMQTTFTKKLGSLIPPYVSFGSQAGEVFKRLRGSFMNDGISQVQSIIDAGYLVAVYSGQVDLIVDTVCIQGWIKKLPWVMLHEYNTAPRIAVPLSKTDIGGFVQKHDNFEFWQINKAGHMVPLDQPEMALYMFRSILRDAGAEKEPHKPLVQSPKRTGEKVKIALRSPRIRRHLP